MDSRNREAGFHGSYRPSDVTFLMKVVDAPDTDIKTKESLIQSGQRHYSEMINREEPPTDEYMEVFRRACALSLRPMAADCLRMALAIRDQAGDRVALVSLARAGTPVGVVVHRLLSGTLGVDSAHYSVSVIRDRGLDGNAMDHIRSGHFDREIVFVDGWTGKGVIADELSSFVKGYNRDRGADVDGGLWVLSDICGKAKFASTTDDYLIPSSVLNSTVSGLVSRSILNDELVDVPAGDFHGCVYYREFEEIDQSVRFADDLTAMAVSMLASGDIPERPVSIDRDAAARASREFMDRTMEEWSVLNRNYVKPGIGEATRVLLRRMPDRLFLRDPDEPQVAHLVHLASTKGVPVAKRPEMPYAACSVIRNLKL